MFCKEDKWSTYISPQILHLGLQIHHPVKVQRLYHHHYIPLQMLDSQNQNQKCQMRSCLSNHQCQNYPLLMASLGLHPLLQVQSELKCLFKLNLISLAKITRARILNSPFSMGCSPFLFSHLPLPPYLANLLRRGWGETVKGFFNLHVHLYF